MKSLDSNSNMDIITALNTKTAHLYEHSNKQHVNAQQMLPLLGHVRVVPQGRLLSWFFQLLLILPHLLLSQPEVRIYFQHNTQLHSFTCAHTHTHTHKHLCPLYTCIYLTVVQKLEQESITVTLVYFVTFKDSTDFPHSIWR